MSDTRALTQALQLAARDLRKRDEPNTVRYEHADAIQTAGGDLATALASLLRSEPTDHLASLVHLARLLKVQGLEGALAEAVLQRPAPLAAKSAAVRLLAESGTAVPEAVTGMLEMAQSFVANPDEAGFDSVMQMPDAWRRPVVEAWSESSLAAEPALVQKAIDRGALQAATAIERLGSGGGEAAVPLVQAFAGAADRQVAKAAKRALHQLKVRGIDVVAPKAEETFSLEITPDVAGDSLAYVTGVDGLGGRILWLLCPGATGGYQLLEAVLDDVHGIRKAELLRTTRSEFRAHMRRLGENPSILVAKVAPADAAHLLQVARAANSDSGTDVPDDFEDFRSGVAAPLFEMDSGWIGALPPPPDSEDARRETLRDCVELLGTGPFANWAVLGDAADAAAAAVRAAETSELLVDDDQRKQQVDDAVAGVADSFDATERARFKARLHEMARVLAAGGEEGQALWARVAGDGFEDVQDLYSDHPFARGIIQRGVMNAYQHLREHEPPPPAGAEQSGLVQP